MEDLNEGTIVFSRKEKVICMLRRIKTIRYNFNQLRYEISFINIFYKSKLYRIKVCRVFKNLSVVGNEIVINIYFLFFIKGEKMKGSQSSRRVLIWVTGIHW